MDIDSGSLHIIYIVAKLGNWKRKPPENVYCKAGPRPDVIEFSHVLSTVYGDADALESL